MENFKLVNNGISSIGGKIYDNRENVIMLTVVDCNDIASIDLDKAQLVDLVNRLDVMLHKLK